jgi:hypothetical protein
MPADAGPKGARAAGDLPSLASCRRGMHTVLDANLLAIVGLALYEDGDVGSFFTLAGSIPEGADDSGSG